LNAFKHAVQRQVYLHRGKRKDPMGADTVKQETCNLGSVAASNIAPGFPRWPRPSSRVAQMWNATRISIMNRSPRQVVVEIIARLRELLFPGYFSRDKIDPLTLRYSLGQVTSETFDLLSEQICRSIRHDCFRYDQACTDCENRGHDLAMQLLDAIPPCAGSWRRRPGTFEGDPAAQSTR